MGPVPAPAQLGEPRGHVATEQGAIGGAAEPLQQGGVGRVEGHHPGGLEQHAAGAGLREEASATGDHHRVRAVEQLGQGGQLHPPEGVLAVPVEDLGRAAAGPALDLQVGVAQLPAEAVGEPPPEGGLAAPGETDQRDRPRAHGTGHRSRLVLRR